MHSRDSRGKSILSTLVLGTSAIPMRLSLELKIKFMSNFLENPEEKTSPNSDGDSASHEASF